MPARRHGLLSTGRDRASLLLLLGTCGLGVHGVVEWVRRVHRLEDLEQRATLLTLRVAALALVVAALGLAWRRRARLLRGETGSTGLALRGLPGAPLVAWTAGSAACVWIANDSATQSSAFWSALIAFVAFWTLLSLRWPARFFSPRRRWLDALAWNLLVTLVLAEVAVSLWAWWHPSPYLWDESSVVASLRARRLVPGTRYLGTAVNSGGYHDEEFRPPRADDERVVAVLADSFGVGVVPHAYNFTTVAERRLAELLPDLEVALDDYGVAGIGMPEYAWLLDNEVSETSPQLVLLCVFVGNDLTSYARRRGGYHAFQRFAVYELLRRVAGSASAVAVGRGGALDARQLASEQAPPVPESGDEVPTFDPDRFLAIERDRLEVTDAHDRRIASRYARFFAYLTAIRQSAGDRLRVVVIPDQFQVDDPLWQQLLAGERSSADRFVRDLPQQRIRAFCAEQGIACLDLLPLLRDAQRTAPVHHLRDTHWNAHGNRVAGEAIAAFLAETLGADAPRVSPAAAPG